MPLPSVKPPIASWKAILPANRWVNIPSEVYLSPSISTECSEQVVSQVDWILLRHEGSRRWSVGSKKLVSSWNGGSRSELGTDTWSYSREKAGLESQGSSKL